MVDLIPSQIIEQSPARADFQSVCCEAKRKIALRARLGQHVRASGVKLKGYKGYSYQTMLGDLSLFVNAIANKNITLKDFNKVIADLKLGNQKSDGAMWTVNFIRKNVGEFSDNAVLRFEYSDATDLGRRYVDLVDETMAAEKRKIFYEMKSVAEVPPGHFKEQFMKDLSNSDITDLSQIRWRFNGEKAPDNFKENMMKAIDQLPLTDDLAKKLLKDVPGDGIEINANLLQQILKEDFDNLFKLIP